ncbi:MAG TPA: hypothetical protein VML50_09990, partial [Anaeromyxobacter sp.]|nr:hypothetical protein [Anaeromyxobacter sp.]
MARVTEEELEEGTEIVRVYLAATLAEAQSVERALDGAGVDYLAEPEEYRAPASIGSRLRTGVGFWVAEAAADPAAGALTRAGLTAGLAERA